MHKPYLRFKGVFYLYDSAERIHQQLNKHVLQGQLGGLRDDVSTDEITPAAILSHYDEALGQFAYTGLSVDGQMPFSTGSFQQRGCQVVVAGKRYGKGSSREHSPAAEMYAGVRLVIAESFERIYRQNADNIGLLTSTNFELLDRILAGEPISIDDIVADRDALSASIVKSGGLLQFGLQHLQSTQVQPSNEPYSGPRTLFEKIIARNVLKTEVSADTVTAGQGVFVKADWRFIHEYYTAMCAQMLKTRLPQPVALRAPEHICVFEDHTSYVTESPAHVRGGLVPNMMSMIHAQRAFIEHYQLRSHRTLSESEALLDDGSNVAGISHAMMAEHYVLPGQLIVGTDSHTPHSGALGCVAFGVGTTDMANAFVTAAVRMTIPEQVRVNLTGTLAMGMTAKDIVLHLLASPRIRAGEGVGKVFEFTGPVVEAFCIDERATLTNMVAELGGFTGIVAPDQKTVDFIAERRDQLIQLEPWMHSDAGAQYAFELSVDCTTLGPMVARPGDPGNGVALRDLAERPRIDIAYGGSCTGGKREDFDAYYQVLKWAHDQGRELAPGVQLYLQYGTTAVRDYCIAQGYDALFRKMGARLLQPSCGACANCGPGVSVEREQVTISAINRNFPGRSGPGSVWLASPPTVVASAVAGKVVSFAELSDSAALCL